MRALLVINDFLKSDKFNEIHHYLLEAGKKEKIDIVLKTNAELMIDLSENKHLEDDLKYIDFILFWDKDIKLAKHLENLNYKVFNSSSAIEICDNKALTHLKLYKSNINMPRTIISPMTYNNIGYTNYNFIKTVEDKLNYPLVVKEVYGSFGKQVYLINNYKEFINTINSINNKEFIFQEYIKSSHGKDIRLQVVGDKVVASMCRYSENNDFRANLSIGGKMKKYTPSKAEEEIALKACKIIGVDFAGVDLLFGEKNKAILCEVNSNAHFKNIFDCTGVNVADHIIKYIIERLKNN